MFKQKGTLSGIQMHTILAPVNINSGTTSDVINLANYNHASVMVSCGAMAAASTMTVEYCTTAAPGTATAMAFSYRTKLNTTDTWGALTACSSGGLSLSVANTDVLIEMDAVELSIASSDTCSRVRLNWSNPGNTDLVSAVAVLGEPRYAAGIPVTAVD